MSTSRRGQFSWCFFDWANSAFPTVIVTFVFATYFTEHVAASKIQGTALWGYALALSGVAIALLSPVMGAVADKRGGRKPWIAFFSLLCMACSMLLWFTLPDPGWVIWGLVIFGLANLFFEVGTVFYNSMLPTIVSPVYLLDVCGVRNPAFWTRSGAEGAYPHRRPNCCCVVFYVRDTTVSVYAGHYS